MMIISTRSFTAGLVLWAAIAPGSEPTALDQYIAQPDSSYRWELVRTVSEPGLTTYVIDLTSQAWRTKADVDCPVWKHWLVVVRPDELQSRKAMLYIGGGDRDDGAPRRADDKLRAIALESKSVVAGLTNVPNQPLVFCGDGKRRHEDDLLAYTWAKFLDTGEAGWLARLAMVKSAVRAMDTVESLLSKPENGALEIDGFVVAGASKRGWTTWLTAAVDRRVKAIIPMVIDVLNVRAQMEHHVAAYGFWAPAVGDYVRHGIPARLDSPRAAELLAIEDPYSYRDRLGLPKYLVNSAGDQFFPPDSSQSYFDDLEGEKCLRYVPNTSHSLGGSDALESVLAFYRMILDGRSRPRFSWEFASDGSIRVTAEDRPREVNLWQAAAPKSRDFRLERLGPAYASSPLAQQEEGKYVANVDVPKKGWVAFFVELAYDAPGPKRLKLTTPVRVLPDVLPHKDMQVRQAGPERR